jgi:predicted NBD/HSP70 family sugar kinase
MYQYAVWVRINNYQTANTTVFADNDCQARMLAEAQYGQGNVLNYSRMN